MVMERRRDHPSAAFERRGGAERRGLMDRRLRAERRGADPAGPDTDASAVALRFFEWADTFVGAVPVRTMAGTDVSCAEWRGAWSAHRDSAGGGRRLVARRWQDGKVVRERVTLHPPAHAQPARALNGTHRLPPVATHG
jgi:hypothetical protein